MWDWEQPEVERIYIRGGNPLEGTIRVGGSKNAALPLMAACLLVEGRTTLRGVPNIRDLRAMAQILRSVGARVQFSGDGDLEIDASGFNGTRSVGELPGTFRASFYVLGPMLARLGQACVAQPGGCQIGARPVDFHIRGMQALGARVLVEGGVVDAVADGLRGARIYLDFPSAGATTHLMMAAALAKGTTLIENAAAEPEVADVANLLRCLGVRVEGAGTSTVLIEGVERLRTDCVYTVIPDRMEAGTFACAAAITRGDVLLENVIQAHLAPVVMKLRDMGVTVKGEGPADMPGAVRVSLKERPRAVDILAMPHPGFPTDMQQPMAALLSVSRGTAMVTDRVFENRFKYATELRKMGADIAVEGSTAFIHGVERLRGAPITATDLRAGAALIVAALAADGESAVSGVEHVDRGYDSLVKKLVHLGADISRVDVETVRKLVEAL
jgi:UDP-N-acetylglucosamine 1-carboxyvinyltransferase